MSVMSFDNHESMQEYLRRAARAAHLGLHPNQQSLTHGDTWVQFYDIANRIIIFGRVATLEQVFEDEVEAGATRDEADLVVAQTKGGLENGYLYGLAYSILCPEGELGHTHKAHAWPIEESVFNAAHDCAWRVDLLHQSEKINLEAAFRAWRGHVRGTR